MNSKTNTPNSRPRLASLSLLVALWTAGVIAIAMAAYAVWQYYSNPGTTLKELMIHHLWHVLILGAVIHVSLWLCFRRLLFQPLNDIYLHLYDLGAGSVSTLTVETSVEEIQTIVDGINIMIWRLDQWMDVESLRNSLAHIEKVKGLAGKVKADPAIANALMEEALALEKTVRAIVKERDVANQTFPSENARTIPAHAL